MLVNSLETCLANSKHPALIGMLQLLGPSMIRTKTRGQMCRGRSCRKIAWLIYCPVPYLLPSLGELFWSSTPCAQVSQAVQRPSVPEFFFLASINREQRNWGSQLICVWLSRQAGKKRVFPLQKILRAVRGRTACVSISKLISPRHEARRVSFWGNLFFLGLVIFFFNSDILSWF